MLCIGIEVVKNIGLCDTSYAVRMLQNENSTFSNTSTFKKRKKFFLKMLASFPVLLEAPNSLHRSH